MPVITTCGLTWSSIATVTALACTFAFVVMSNSGQGLTLISDGGAGGTDGVMTVDIWTGGVHCNLLAQKMKGEISAIACSSNATSIDRGKLTVCDFGKVLLGIRISTILLLPFSLAATICAILTRFHPKLRAKVLPPTIGSLTALCAAICSGSLVWFYGFRPMMGDSNKCPAALGLVNGNSVIPLVLNVLFYLKASPLLCCGGYSYRHQLAALRRQEEMEAAGGASEVAGQYSRHQFLSEQHQHQHYSASVRSSDNNHHELQQPMLPTAVYASEGHIVQAQVVQPVVEAVPTAQYSSPTIQHW